jgi:hypothetical protein
MVRHATQSHVTIDHDEIRSWVRERGGRPARVRGTGSANDPGLLRIDFPGYSGRDSLEEVSWDEFFEKFDRNNLALVIQDSTSSGEKSNFTKIISRDSIDSQNE